MGEVTTTKKTGRKTAKKDELAALTARIVELERKQALVDESYGFVANETRNLFGFGAIAQIFDAISSKLTK